MTKVREALNWWDTLSETKKTELTKQYYDHPFEAELTSDEVLEIFFQQSNVAPPESNYTPKTGDTVYPAPIPTGTMVKRTAEEVSVLEALAKADQQLHDMIDDIEKAGDNPKSALVIQHLSKAHEIIHNYEDSPSSELPDECQSKDDGVCFLPIGSCKQCAEKPTGFSKPIDEIIPADLYPNIKNTEGRLVSIFQYLKTLEGKYESALRDGYIAGADAFDATHLGMDVIEEKADQFIKYINDKL